jgi:hypothetical protein
MSTVSFSSRRPYPGRPLLALALGALVAGACAGACATLGSPAGGDVGLPSANMGPFRVLTKTEEPISPFVLDSTSYQFREPSALAVDPGDPRSMNVYLYVVATLTTGTTTEDVLMRTRAEDARSFYGTSLDSSHVPPVVLAPSLPWEGTHLSGPSALRVGQEYYLYYAAEGGIGLARSADGLSFQKNPVPVLTPDPAARWETTTPSAPSVAVLPDGTFDMMYAAGVSIGEATSHDGITFTRVDGDPETPGLDPVLSPLGSRGPVPDGAIGPIDTGQVSDPCVVPVTTPGGRLDVRVLYTGYDGPPGDATRGSAIGFAARYGNKGRLERQPLPVFSISMHEAAPTYFEWGGGEMLYVQATVSALIGASYVSVAAGIAPATVTLKAPVSYASSP